MTIIDPSAEANYEVFIFGEWHPCFEEGNAYLIPNIKRKPGLHMMIGTGALIKRLVSGLAREVRK